MWRSCSSTWCREASRMEAASSGSGDQVKRVKVTDIEGEKGYTGEALRAFLEPILARGESVVLDFQGTDHSCSGVFFWVGLGRLIEADTENRLPELLHFDNLSHLGQLSLDSIRDFAIRRRENPRWAEAMGQVAMKHAERERRLRTPFAPQSSTSGRTRRATPTDFWWTPTSGPGTTAPVRM